MSESFDAIVLGGGPGGYVCAIRLGQLGLKVACIEAEEYGGVCLNWGCVPSKALISAAHLYEKGKTASEVGINFGEATINPQKLQDWKNGIVKKFTSGVRGLLKANGATVIEGFGKLVDSKIVEVTKADGSKSRVVAERAVVLATGSSTIQIPGFEFDGKDIIGAREAVSLTEIPKRLAVIGGGVIGLELGMVYQAMGSELTVVELTGSILPGQDEEAIRLVDKHIKKKGGKVLTDTKALGYERQSDGTLKLKLEGKDGPFQVDCDKILVAVGMKPRSRDLGLEAVGVQIDQRGFISTDDQCQTNIPGVYAIGDVSGAPMLAHKASKEGEVAAEVIAGHAAGKDWTAIPGVIFTDPEIGSVGLTVAQAKAEGRAVKVGKFPFSAMARSATVRETDGFVKMVCDADTNVVLGVTIVGPSASDLISEAVLAVEMGATAEDLGLSIHPHPTLGESMMEAGAAVLGHAIHIVNR